MTPPPNPKHSPLPAEAKNAVRMRAYRALCIIGDGSPEYDGCIHDAEAYMKELESEKAALVEALGRIEREARTEYIAKIATDALAGHDMGRDLETAVHDALVMLPASRYDRETNDALNAVRDRLSEALSKAHPHDDAKGASTNHTSGGGDA